MRAIRSTLSKGFTGGIKPYDESLRNGELFDECKNVVAGKEGLKGYVSYINDILDPSRKFYDSVTTNEITLTRRWPFPQVFLTDAGVFIGALEGMYRVTIPSPTRYPNIVLFSYGTGATVWPWVCIPILGYPAFTSGTRFLYYDENSTAYVVVS
jgi:hypothetical protein